MKIKVGIFFGGPSREREISFAGGRTVYDNLDKSIFEAIPIFVDSYRNFIQLEWSYLYKGTIRDFFPPVQALPESPNQFQVYQESLGETTQALTQELLESVGTPIAPDELPQLISVAFLALHGVYGEDGQIQQELDRLRIPYTGSGIEACAIGMDKGVQKELMAQKGFNMPKVEVIHRADWVAGKAQEWYEKVKSDIHFPVVIRPANQGSSIGVSIIDEKSGLAAFEEAVDRAFFREIIPLAHWKNQSDYQRADHIRLLTDIREGIGFPLDITLGEKKTTLFHPEALLKFLNEETAANPNSQDNFLLEGLLSEEKVILESFISGKEFSCIVVRREDGGVVALPPTEIVKGGEVFDYKSKYMPGRSRKETPILLPDKRIHAIRQECERLFTALGFATYARIDGFIQEDGRIFLNDPNTTSGMLPSSFFFHQAAEIGLNPSQLLTYIIRISLQERLAEQPKEETYKAVLNFLDDKIVESKSFESQRKQIGIILGGTSFERHISVESGRNIYEKLSSSATYQPLPIFLSAYDGSNFQLCQIPISLLLKDNADDIFTKIENYSTLPVLEEIRLSCKDITDKYAPGNTIFTPQEITIEQLPDRVDQVFIALHGRPGEDGTLQQALDEVGLSYNGSGAKSSSITIDKYKTLQTLKRNGFSVTQQQLMRRSDFESDQAQFLEQVEQIFAYPLIAKPVDDGCSSAVMVINTREELDAYTRLMFRAATDQGLAFRKVLKLDPKAEFPIKDTILFETRISSGGAKRFLEVTVGLITSVTPDGTINYQVFEPSEALSSGDVLSVEEKFLAGEGQNITPARFADDQSDYDYIATQVKDDLEKAARILDIRGYARIDAFVRIFPDNSAETIIVEVNSLPGMTPATVIFHQAALAGFQPSAFIQQILTYAENQHHAEIQETAQNHLSNAQEEAILPVGKPTMTEQTQATPPPPKDNFFTRVFNSLLAFLQSAIFLRNLGVMVGFLILFFFLIKGALRMYTHHGESLEVHDYRGMSITQAQRKAKERSFTVAVLDSVFMPNRISNEVIDQTPRPFSRVKENRTIYLTITRGVAPEVPLPSLVGSDEFEQYRRKLDRLNIDLVVADKQYDRKLEENTILYLVYEGERYTPKQLEAGVRIPKGSQIGAVISVRNTGQAQVPNLVCQQFSEASFNISSRQLIVGRVEGATGSPQSYYVWKQDPPAGTMLSVGASVNIYLQANKPDGCQ